MMSPKYKQLNFEKELKVMLAYAKANGKSSLSVISGNLHSRVVTKGDNRMPMACNAMWNLWRQQGSNQDAIIRTTDSGQSSTIEIEFDTL